MANKVTERIFKNPVSSFIGLILVGAGIYVLNIKDLESTVQLAASTLLIGGGLVALGLKDRKNTEEEV